MSLTGAGVFIDREWLVNKIGQEGLRKIKSIFTIETIGHNNTKKTISSFRLIKSKGVKPQISIPRFGGFMLLDTNILDRVDNRLQMGEVCDFTGSLYVLTPNQKVVVEYLKSFIYNHDTIKKGIGSTILQMDPGYGKTYLALGIIRLIGRKTFIIVPNTYLLRQWVEVLGKAFPNNTIGCYYGVKKNDGDIVVAIINSALKYPDYIKHGLVIYDEVHMYCSKKFAAIFTMAQSSHCLGITATPTDRIDKFDPVAQWALGKVIYAEKIPGWNHSAVNFTTEVTRVIYNGHIEYTKIIESAAGIVSVPLMINQLQKDPYRNKIIVAYAIKLYNMGRNVFVFSDRREHLHGIADALREHRVMFEAPELGITHNQNILDGVTELMGGSTDADIENAKHAGRIIMTTYQYTSVGVSINKMDSIILATPRKSNMKQIMGRIYRLTSDPTIVRQIIDLVDNRICLKSQYYSRKKTYIDKLHANIVDKKIGWGDCTDEFMASCIH
jgi:superfamily II DNA or RNA helicase